MMVIYKATNKVNGKIYVGATSQRLAMRIAQHKSRAGKGRTAFAHAIHKYGFESFDWSVLEQCATKADLDAAECRWIAELGSLTHQHGYNRTTGGAGTSGVVPTEETRKKLSEALRRRVITQETRDKLRANMRARTDLHIGGWNRGMKSSPEAIAKIKANHVGTLGYRHAPETLARMSEIQSARAAGGIGLKVTYDKWPDIRARRAAGETFRSIGDAYGVCKETIFYFCKRHEVRA